MEKLTFQSTMQLRNGVKMPRFGFGTAEIAPTLAEQVTIIRNAIDVGYRLPVSYTHLTLPTIRLV